MTQPAESDNPKEQRPARKAKESTETSRPSDSAYDAFILAETFPDPRATLIPTPEINEIAKACLFVLDTNCLLAPFRVGKDSLADIARIYRSLSKEHRLFIPAHGLREFARNRTKLIADIYRYLLDKKSHLPSLPVLEVPMLEDTEPYKKSLKHFKDMSTATKAYKAELDAMLVQIRDWNIADPVSKLYLEICLTKNIVDTEESREIILSDLARRTLHKLPPGFKDATKDDGGIGDLLIWHTILRIGREQKRDVIFITNEKKPDWVIKLDDETVFPRYELVTEFKAKTGKHFSILAFSRFLELRGASESTVKEAAYTSAPITKVLGTAPIVLKFLTAAELNQLLAAIDRVAGLKKQIASQNLILSDAHLELPVAETLFINMLESLNAFKQAEFHALVVQANGTMPFDIAFSTVMGDRDVYKAEDILKVGYVVERIRTILPSIQFVSLVLEHPPSSSPTWRHSS